VAVTDFEHVGIVPVAGAGVLLDAVLGARNEVHVVIVVGNVVRGAPGIAADRGAPFPDFAQAILAEAKDDRAAGFDESFVHPLVDLPHLLGLVEVGGAAPIVLEVIHAPGCISGGILLFVLVAAGISAAGLRS